MTIPITIPSRLPEYKPTILPYTGGNIPSGPYDTGLRLGVIRFTNYLIGKDIGNGGEHAFGDSWLVEARNLTTGAYSTAKYELCWDAEDPNEGFIFVYDDGAYGDPFGAAADGAYRIYFAQPNVFDITVNEGDYLYAIALAVKTGWCIVRVEPVNNISGNVVCTVE